MLDFSAEQRYFISDPQQYSAERTIMLHFIIRRTLYSFLILFGVLILTFVLFRMAAGDPTATLLGKNPTPEEVERLRESLGADRPLFYGKWRRTELFTNASFAKERLKFIHVTLNGSHQAGKDGVMLEDGSTLTFVRNFAPEKGKPLRISIHTGGTVDCNGVILESEDGVIRQELQDIPEKLVIRACAQTVIRGVEFERESENPWDSQLLASLREIVCFQDEFPYVSFFNFGVTLQTREPIREKLWRGMLPSLMVMLPVFFGEMFFGLILAMISCVWRGSWIDRFILVLSVAGLSISYLALIIFGQWLLGYYWNWFPVWGWGGLNYLFLPVIIGIISGTGSGARFYRTVFLNESNREYLRTAVAKGASPVAVYGKHMLRNSLIPIITRASGVLPFLFTGSLLLESFFGIPGLGSAGINALHDADLQMLKALVILSSILFVVINLLTDIAYAYVDPRMRPEK